MGTLPSSIQAYLDEAGFSGTEVLVLEKLLDQDTSTLREMALKTGKSTGVLDQAMKKLLKKGVVVREMVNDSPKYVLHSLQSVQEWMKNDMQQKTQLIIRKYENFDKFIQTVTKEKTRPDVQFFEGIDGLKRAYNQLLKRGKIFLRYGPTNYTPEDNPLADFYPQYYQECHNHGIFTRVITHDTPLGRRHQSRDAFEFRQTILVDQREEPFMFEKIIVGDTLACFHLETKQACVMRYNDFAEEERSFFEILWHRQQEKDKQKAEWARRNAGAIVIPLKNEILSHLKEFFFGRKGIIGLSTCAGIAAVLTGIFYWQMANANLQRIREQVKSVAATGALQFKAEDLDQLQTKADITKPEYAKVIDVLNKIRNQNPDLVYAYIVRPTAEKNVFEYVADADSLHPDIVIDVNKDGVIDDADANVIPGEKYTAGNDLTDIYHDELPAAAKKPFTDQWGTFVDGAAPIRDKDGIIRAHLGVNKWAKDIYAGYSIGNIIGFFVFAFLIVLGIWLTAFDQYVLKEIQKYMKEQKNVSAQLLQFFFTKRSALVIMGLAVVSGLITFALYQNDAGLNLKRMQDKVLSIAATGALQFDAKDLNQIHTPADISKPEYAKVIYLLNAIRKQNDGVKYMFIMRPTANAGTWEFIADADSLDPYAVKDVNGDGKIDEVDHLDPPGELDSSTDTASMKMALQKPYAAKEPFKTQWGILVSAFAPIHDSEGRTVAILGVDRLSSDVKDLTSQTIQPIYYFLLIFLVLLVIRLAAFNRSLFKEICEIIRIRKVAITIGLAALVSIGITFGIYEYTQHLTMTRMQDKVLAIAITAAPQFDAKDLEALQIKEDWKKPEWAKLGNQLAKIRRENTGVMYAYIIRKSKTDPGKMEFAGDADSINPFANTDNDPTNDVDMNRDGEIDGGPTGGDYQSWPGQAYIGGPLEEFDAYDGPTTTHSFFEDQYGKVITGYAPIKDKNGNIVAILAIDIGAVNQNVLTGEVFAPLYVFLAFFVLFILFRMKGFSASLLHQLLRPFHNRFTILIIVFALTLLAGIVFWMYQYTLYLMKEEIGTRLMSIAATAAPEFTVDDLNQLHIAGDMKKDAYQRVFKKLNEVRKHNEKITYAYIERPTKELGIWEFIADADSNYYIPFENSLDPNGDGKLDAADENVYPGKAIDVVKNHYKIDTPFFEGPSSNQWGIYLSGYAPIRDAHGNAIAVLGLDMDVSDVYKSTKKRFGF